MSKRKSNYSWLITARPQSEELFSMTDEQIRALFQELVTVCANPKDPDYQSALLALSMVSMEMANRLGM